MVVLLDTQALIWTLIDSPRLTPNARTTIQQADVVYVSPISFYEIAIKAALGKDTGIDWPVRQIINESLLSGFSWLPLSANHIESYMSVPLFSQHKDPFDRILLATAIAGDLTVVSSDYNFALYSDLVSFIWQTHHRADTARHPVGHDLMKLYKSSCGNSRFSRIPFSFRKARAASRPVRLLSSVKM